MTHRLLILISCTLLMASCSEPKRVEKKVSLRDSWYRHYTGTIAGKPVHVNLHCSNQQVMGFYSYDEQKVPIALYDDDEDASMKSGNTLNLREHTVTQEEDSEDGAYSALWNVTLTGHKITGKWISSDGADMYDVALEESYPKGVNRFGILRVDTAAGEGETTLISSDVVTLPLFNNPILDTALFSKLRCGQDESYRQCLLARAGKYFAGHLDKTHNRGDTGRSHYYETKGAVYVVYNRRDIVVMVCRGHLTVDHIHGRYSSAYICADVKDNRRWHLRDILEVDTPKLAQIITNVARRVYNIAPGQPLSTKLHVDKIPITNNIYFTGRGIAFNYGPHEIGTEDDAEISLFIPFSKLGSMLKPEFKERMGLK